MSTNYPTSLDTITNPVSTDSVATVDHAAQHANANDAIEALEAKVGADGSAVTTSHDYKLGEVTSADKAVGKTATQTLTNKTLTSPTITTPTITVPVIADFTNANHNHQGASGGGQLSATSVFSGGTVPTARLGSGSASTINFLRGDQTWAKPVIQYAAGQTTHDLSSTVDTVIAHGLGLTPALVHVRAFFSDSAVVNMAFSLMFNGTQYSASQAWDTGTGTGQNLANDFRIYATAVGNSAREIGTIVVDTTNITISWSKNNSPTGTANIIWDAIA